MPGINDILAAAQDIRGPASIDAALHSFDTSGPSPLQGVGPVPQAPAVPTVPSGAPGTPAVAPAPAPQPTPTGLSLDSETRLALISRLDSLKASLLSTPTIDPELVGEISSISELINPEQTGVPLV